MAYGYINTRTCCTVVIWFLFLSLLLLLIAVSVSLFRSFGMRNIKLVFYKMPTVKQQSERRPPNANPFLSSLMQFSFQMRTLSISSGQIIARVTRNNHILISFQFIFSVSSLSFSLFFSFPEFRLLTHIVHSLPILLASFIRWCTYVYAYIFLFSYVLPLLTSLHSNVKWCDDDYNNNSNSNNNNDDDVVVETEYPCENYQKKRERGRQKVCEGDRDKVNE